MKGRKDKIVAIVPAAGLGKRFGYGKSKTFHSLFEKPVIIWSLEALQSVEEITEIVLVLKEEDLVSGSNLIENYNITKVSYIVPGGKERQDSVCNGIKILGDKTSVAVIHDGARPLVEKDLIRRTIMELKGFDGVIAGVPAKDTIKEGRRQGTEIVVSKTLNRHILWSIQTPQAFHFQKIKDAYERAVTEKYYATDEAALIERYGGKVKVIMGSYRNIKITTAEDIYIAEALLSTQAI
ncbi:2-C-methyl-D-erythritol 4-phosphate cytidylyltransferase [Thermodesulfovibrionales bacterium]|nr:2-C-methyl-D-erythritol 4-phosphate cytidylyltransferase [Thermodesulfovibrionales bacterium]